MVSSTKAVKRYYPPEVRAAVTELLISRERHQVGFFVPLDHVLCT